jgi:hypothetical protein
MDLRILILEELGEYFMKEEYPSSFNHEEFAKLRSFAERVRYCEQHLQKLAAGSSRIVYRIDNEKVLKLAKNPKGIAQNELEIRLGNDWYLEKEGIIAKVFNSDENNQWVEMEFAKKTTPTNFKNITGVDIKILATYLRIREDEFKGRKSWVSLDPQTREMCDENEFVASIVDFMHNYDMPAGDLGRLSSYGEVIHDGHPSIVVIDFGLDQEVYNTYYDRSKKVAYQPRY